MQNIKLQLDNLFSRLTREEQARYAGYAEQIINIWGPVLQARMISAIEQRLQQRFAPVFNQLDVLENKLQKIEISCLHLCDSLMKLIDATARLGARLGSTSLSSQLNSKNNLRKRVKRIKKKIKAAHIQ